MKVSEAMTNDVRIADPDETIEQAARTLAEIDAGALPVGEDDRLVGMITDRVRIPQGLAPGDYVLSWRWDCEETAQIWANCADVVIDA